MTWEQWVSIIALVLATAAVVVGLVLWRTISARSAKAPVGGPPARSEGADQGPPAFVVNPIKVTDVAALRRLVTDTCAELGLPAPLWFETTEQDPGLGQAEQALATGASVVVAAGGDGTVRAVGTALAGSSVPMGLVPTGTGNLLARNVDLPLDSIDSLVRTALTGNEHPIDLGWIRPRQLRPASAEGDLPADVVEAARGQQRHYETDTTTIADPTTSDDAPATTGAEEHAAEGADRGHSAPGTPIAVPADQLGPPVGSVEKEPRDALARRTEHLFLVIGGIGFDAAMVAGADDNLKKRMGWFAYFVAGVRHLHGRKIRLQVQIGDAAAQSLKLRTLLFANCGRLPGGMVLLPDAEIDDGWLDIAAIDTRGGLFGWASLFGQVIGHGVGIRRRLAGSPSSITTWRGREVRVRCDQPEPIQVDGDLIGTASHLSVRVDHGALILRTNS